MGGWSNINIRGKSSELEFVLKLPWSMTKFDQNPYTRLYELGLYFSRLDLTPQPIEIGRLSDSSRTPFYLVEYVDGTTYSAITETSENEILSLKESLRILKKQKPSGIATYRSPSDYLLVSHKQVENHSWLHQASEVTRVLVDKYESLLSRLKDKTDTLGHWSGNVMHGDLWMPNIVFRPDKKAILLDFEACAFGDSRYDLAYLLETHEDSTSVSIPALIQDEDINLVNSLRPLVLAYIIDWSLARLLSMESGIVEPNLNTATLRIQILGYVKEKIARLKLLTS
jgi:aminoglycoside phosphotransferase (APT) family kinase protein